MNKQYILNQNILMANVPAGEDGASICLPHGIWTDFYTGKEYTGGTLTLNKPKCSDTIILVRENSAVIEEIPGSDACEVRVYALRNGIRIDADAYGAGTEPELSVSIKRNGRSIHIAADGTKPYTVRMVNMCAKSASNGLIVIEGSDSVITPDEWCCTMEITF